MIVAYRSASKQDGGTAHQIVLIVLVARANMLIFVASADFSGHCDHLWPTLPIRVQVQAMQFASQRCDMMWLVSRFGQDYEGNSSCSSDEAIVKQQPRRNLEDICDILRLRPAVVSCGAHTAIASI